MSVAALTLNAQVYSEYFDGIKVDGDELVAGDEIEDDYNGWYVNGKSTNQDIAGNDMASPVVSSEDVLFYGDYIGSEIGQPVAIDSAVGYGADNRSSNWAVAGGGDTLRIPDSGAVYTAFLFKPLAQSKDSYRDFFGYEFTITTNTSRGRVFMKIVDGDVQFGVSKNASGISSGLDTAATITNGVDQTYLMVLKYEIGDADVSYDDTVRLYINPNPLLSEAEQTGTLLTNKDSTTSDRSEGTIVRLNIRQRGHNGLFGGIRVGTDWEDVLQGASVKGVTLSDSALTIPKEQTRTLVANVTFGAVDASVTWSSSDDAVATVDAEGVVTAVAEGTATITVTTTDGSFTADCAVTVIPFSGVTSSSLSEVSLYPNPSNGEFSIDNSKGADVKVYSITGKLVYELNNISDNQSVVTDLPSGMYAVSIVSAGAQKITKLIIE